MLLQVIDTVTSSGSGYSSLQDSLARHGAGGGQADQQLVRHILKLLSAKVTTRGYNNLHNITKIFSLNKPRPVSDV